MTNEIVIENFCVLTVNNMQIDYKMCVCMCVYTTMTIYSYYIVHKLLNDYMHKSISNCMCSALECPSLAHIIKYKIWCVRWNIVYLLHLSAENQLKIEFNLMQWMSSVLKEK